MGKGSTILGIIGILIGAGGLGFGVITWMNQSNVNIWNDYEQDDFIPTFAEYDYIPDFYIIVDIPTTVQLYVTFTASTRINVNPASYADIIFYFIIDGVRLLHPTTRVGPYQGGANVDYLSVTLQYFNPSFSAGRHNISIIVWSETPGNLIRECLLTAQSYPI